MERFLLQFFQQRLEIYRDRVFFSVFLKIRKRNFIRLFELPVIFAFFLDCIVGQVDHLAIQVFKSELYGGGPDVALLVPVPLDVAVG